MCPEGDTISLYSRLPHLQEAVPHSLRGLRDKAHSLWAGQQLSSFRITPVLVPVPEPRAQANHS